MLFTLELLCKWQIKFLKRWGLYSESVTIDENDWKLIKNFKNLWEMVSRIFLNEDQKFDIIQ